MVKDRKAWRAAVHGSQRAGHDLVTEQTAKCFWNHKTLQIAKVIPSKKKKAGDTTISDFKGIVIKTVCFYGMA